jgi:hypothetical protein
MASRRFGNGAHDKRGQNGRVSHRGKDAPDHRGSKLRDGPLDKDDPFSIPFFKAHPSAVDLRDPNEKLNALISKLEAELDPGGSSRR